MPRVLSFLLVATAFKHSYQYQKPTASLDTQDHKGSKPKAKEHLPSTHLESTGGAAAAGLTTALLGRPCSSGLPRDSESADCSESCQKDRVCAPARLSNCVASLHTQLPPLWSLPPLCYSRV